MKASGILYLTLISCFLTFSSCDNSPEQSANEAIEYGNPQFADAATGKAYADYIALKDALVASNATKAQSHASALRQSLHAANATKAGDIAGEIAASSDLKTQREKFTVLSNLMEQFVKDAKLSSGKLYKAYCPMANNGEGGNWLSSENDINNPYYGDEMLKCGVIEETIE